MTGILPAATTAPWGAHVSHPIHGAWLASLLPPRTAPHGVSTSQTIPATWGCSFRTGCNPEAPCGAHTFHAIHAARRGSFIRQVPNTAQHGAHISHAIRTARLGPLWWLPVEPIHPIPQHLSPQHAPLTAPRQGHPSCPPGPAIPPPTLSSPSQPQGHPEVTPHLPLGCLRTPLPALCLRLPGVWDANA